MKTLRDSRDLWNAFEDLNGIWTSARILDELSRHIGADRLRRFIDDVVREWDLEDYFREYEEFAEEEE